MLRWAIKMTVKAATVTPKRPRGRPRKGLAPGEAVGSYQRVTVRLPAASKARLMALADVTGTPAWTLIAYAVDHLWENTTPDVREVAGKLAKRKVARYQGIADADTE